MSSWRHLRAWPLTALGITCGGGCLLCVTLINAASDNNDPLPPSASSPLLQRNALLKRKLAAASSSSSSSWAAAQQLVALQTGLDKGQKVQIAQAMPLNTALALARSDGAHKDLFLAQPQLPPDILASDAEFHLRSLVRNALGRLSQALADEHDAKLAQMLESASLLSLAATVTDDDDDDDAHLESEFMRDSHQLILPERARLSRSAQLERLLQVLGLLTESKVAAKLLVEDLYLLSALQNVLLDAPDQMKLKALAAKILLNLSRDGRLAEILYRTGWLGVLSGWRRDSEPRIALSANTALANLDPDSGVEYESGLYLLSGCEEKKTKVDVVFIHGLLGGVFYTWREMDPGNSKGPSASNSSLEEYSRCWPRDWLKPLEGQARVLGVHYQSSVSHWLSQGGATEQLSLSQRAAAISDQLKAAGVSSDPVIFVTHSMGGLIAKHLLLRDDSLARACAGVVFFSTPHKGSPVAAINASLRHLLSPSQDVQELRFESPALKELHEKFLGCVRENKIEIVSFGETAATKGLGLSLLFVPEESSWMEVGSYEALETDHMNTCKPKGKNAPQFKELMRLIENVLDNKD